MDIAIPTLDQVLRKVDAFLTRHGMAESRLGRDATGESSLITTMREGRHPSLKTLNRLDAFMTEYDSNASATTASASPGKGGEVSGGVAVCSICDLRAEDPAVRSCTASDCGLAVRPAA